MPKKQEIGFKIRNKDLSNFDDDEVCILSLSSILLAVIQASGLITKMIIIFWSWHIVLENCFFPSFMVAAFYGDCWCPIETEVFNRIT